MRRMLKIAAAMMALAATQAGAGPLADIRCEATHSVACGGEACGYSGGDGANRVGFDISTVSGRGHLCTYTYCRDFVLVPLPGQDLDAALATLSGLTLSERRGSTGDDLERPAIDYQLSVSGDRTRFVLGHLVDGGFTGWAGTCVAATGDGPEQAD